MELWIAFLKSFIIFQVQGDRLQEGILTGNSQQPTHRRGTIHREGGGQEGSHISSVRFKFIAATLKDPLSLLMLGIFCEN